MSLSVQNILSFASDSALQRLLQDALISSEIDAAQAIYTSLNNRGAKLDGRELFSMSENGLFGAVIKSKNPEVLRWARQRGIEMQASYYSKDLVDDHALISAKSIGAVFDAGEDFARAFFFDCANPGYPFGDGKILYVIEKQISHEYVSAIGLALASGYERLARELVSSAKTVSQFDLLSIEALAPDLYDEASSKVGRCQLLCPLRGENSFILSSHFGARYSGSVYNRVFDTLKALNGKIALFGNDEPSGDLVAILKGAIHRSAMQPAAAVNALLEASLEAGVKRSEISSVLAGTFSSSSFSEGEETLARLERFLADGWIDPQAMLESWVRGYSSQSSFPVAVLVAHGASLEAMVGGETYLASCVSGGKDEMAGLLIKAGADLDVKTQSGRTLLQAAAPPLRTLIRAERARRDLEGQFVDSVAAPTQPRAVRGMSL